MKCPKCKMKIPNGAEICPYCRSKVQGFGIFGDVYDDFKKGYKKTNANLSNSGCMVSLSLFVIVVSSICLLII